MGEPVAFVISIEVWADPDHMAQQTHPGRRPLFDGEDPDPPLNRWDTLTTKIIDNLLQTPGIAATGHAHVRRMSPGDPQVTADALMEAQHKIMDGLARVEADCAAALARVEGR